MKRVSLGFFGVVIALFSCNASAADYRQAEEARIQQEQWERSQGNPSVIALNNAHVSRDGYVPKDLVEQGRKEGFSCDEYGNRTASTTGYCRDFKSRSEGSAWRVRFASQHGSSAEHVFKQSNGSYTLWARFNPGNQRLEYASPAAQQYAAIHGGGTAVTRGNTPQQVPQHEAQGACDHLSGKVRAGCEAATNAGPGIGGLLKW